MLNIHLRPHHFLCTINFKKKGYSPDFVQNFSKILKQLKDNPDQKITIVGQADSICSACPKRHHAECDKPLILTLDKRHADAFGLTPGSIVSWAEAFQKIRQKLTIPLFLQICQGCPWLDVGICLENIKKILN